MSFSGIQSPGFNPRMVHFWLLLSDHTPAPPMTPGGLMDWCFLASNSEGQEQIWGNKWPLEAAKNTETPINACPGLWYSFWTGWIFQLAHEHMCKMILSGSSDGRKFPFLAVMFAVAVQLATRKGIRSGEAHFQSFSTSMHG